MSDTILVTKHDGWVEIALNRPDRLNSFTEEMHLALRAALDAAAADARAVLLTGSGRGFCAGQDLGDRDPRKLDDIDLGKTVRNLWAPLVRQIRALEMPVVCAVNGVAAGAGSSLALACDMVFASDKAKFIQSFASQQAAEGTDQDGRNKQRRNSNKPAHVEAFQNRLQADAEMASKITGIPAKFMLAQAALETGWGKKEIVTRDGRSAHNLFGIKATGNWTGKVVEATTIEYINGKPQKRVEKFRAYDSYADAFKDYANLLRSNPRYEKVLASAQDAHGFAYGLQRAGYATDPHYAEKLSRIIRQSLSA